MSSLCSVRSVPMIIVTTLSMIQCGFFLLRSVCSADGLLMAGLSLTVNTALVTVLYFGGALVRQGTAFCYYQETHQLSECYERVVLGKLSMGRLTSFAIYSSMVGLGCSSLSGVSLWQTSLTFITFFPCTVALTLNSFVTPLYRC